MAHKHLQALFSSNFGNVMYVSRFILGLWEFKFVGNFFYNYRQWNGKITLIIYIYDDDIIYYYIISKNS